MSERSKAVWNYLNDLSEEARNETLEQIADQLKALKFLSNCERVYYGAKGSKVVKSWHSSQGELLGQLLEELDD